MVLIFVKNLCNRNSEVFAKIMTDVLLVFSAIHINPVPCKVIWWPRIIILYLVGVQSEMTSSRQREVES